MYIIRMLTHTEEKPYGKSVHTGEEPFIYDFIIVSLFKNRFTRIIPCQTNWLKSTNWSQKTIGPKGIANVMLKYFLFILFCKTDADFHQIAIFIL